MAVIPGRYIKGLNPRPLHSYGAVIGVGTNYFEADLTSLPEMTWEIWVRSDPSLDFDDPYTAILWHNSDTCLVLAKTGEAATFKIWASVKGQAQNATALTDDSALYTSWRLIGLTYSAADDRKCHIYLDGVELDSAQTQGGAYIEVELPLQITPKMYDSAAFLGQIAELRVSSIARTSAEMLSSYQKGIPIEDDPNVVLHLGLSEPYTTDSMGLGVTAHGTAIDYKEQFFKSTT
jgi:hypothetical protein